MTEYYKGDKYTAKDVREAARVPRVFRIVLDENGQVSDLWVKLKLSDIFSIDSVSFYRPNDTSLAYDGWLEGSRTTIEEDTLDNFWYIANGAWACRMEPDGADFKLWGFYHRQYHGTLLGKGGRYIEINQKLLAEKLGIPEKKLNRLHAIYRDVDSKKLQKVCDEYKQRKYILI